jgi:hypothetical protein
MRTRYYDDLCDRCRIYTKYEVYILCVKCKDEWLSYGMKTLKDKPQGSILNDEFEIWFKSTSKHKPFIFR